MKIWSTGEDVVTPLTDRTSNGADGVSPLKLEERAIAPVPLRPRQERPFQRWTRRQERQTLVREIPEGDSGVAIARRDTAYRIGLVVADMVAAAFAVAIGVMVLGHLHPNPAAFAALMIVPLVAKVVGLYDRDEHLIRKTTLDEVPALFQAATLYTLILWISEYQLFDDGLMHRQVLALWGLFFVSMALARTLARRVVRVIARPERCLVIGDVDSAEPVRRKLRTNLDLNAILVGRVPLEDEAPLPDVVGELDNLGIVLAEHDIDRVLIAPGHQDPELILHTIRMVKSMGVKVSVLPRLFEVVGSAVEFDDLDGIPLLGLRGQGLPRSSRMLKRAVDIAVASLILLLLGPALLLIALMIRLDSPGPVLFRQRRIGRHGHAFSIYKFRTMYDGADSMKQQLMSRNEGADGFFKIADDPRVTRVGRWLRKTYLDELPQLINVVRGEMSLVGPRPLVADEDRRINGWQRGRLDLTPGMTGFWQVLGSSRVPLHEMVKIDYLYATNWSLWLDLKVILRTVPYVLARRGL
jgi:exopolysaccharide biosynthesis polyprenyl glycosylphosphotransferase